MNTLIPREKRGPGTGQGIDIRARFWRHVKLSENYCWEWDAAVLWDGYGAFDVNGRQTRAHRVSYELDIGPIPAGYQIDHLCLNPQCVRPDHLEAVTPAENTRRALLGTTRLYCKFGHRMTPENVVAIGVKKLFRRCRICLAEYKKNYKRRPRGRK